MGIRVLSLFDGMGCGRIALEELGVKVDTYYASEVDKNAIAVETLNFPDTVCLGDVTKVDARKLGHIDLLIGGSPCFAAGTKVLTKEGYKNIEDVKIGDMVLTHKNRWRKVLDFGCKMADTFEVQTQCSAPIVCTANHKFWARKKFFEWKSDIRTRRMELGKADWVEAEKLKGEYYVCSNRPKVDGDGLDITLEEAWVLGRYLADGHIPYSIKTKTYKHPRANQVILVIGNDKVDGFKAAVSTLSYTITPQNSSCCRIVFNNKHLTDLCEEHCGCGSEHKFISKAIFNSAPDVKKAFLAGYLAGDGSVKDNKVQIITVSHTLALCLQRLILDVEQVHSNIYLYDRGSTWVIEGREVNQKPQYYVKYIRGIKGKVIYDEDKIWYGVKKYIPVGEQLVYNITVDEDHSYTVENVVVKNCQSFSFAGRRNGMSTETNEEVYTLDRYMELKRDGFQFVGESYLFWEYMRILGELRETNPDVFFFLENVEMGEKWEKVLTDAIGIPGVHVNSALVSAQNRRRIYWTNIRTKEEGLLGWTVPDIPQPEDRGIMLQDVLDDDVDRKYYLKDSVVDKLLANGVKGAE